MRTQLAVLFPLVLFSTNAMAADVAWTVDTFHSSVGFSVKHLGISNVKGEFKDYSAVLMGDPASGKINSVEATAKVASIDTRIAKRDEHLKGEDFFAADKFPELKIKSKTVVWKGNKFTGTAEITIREVTKLVPFSGELLGTQKVDFGDGPQLRAGYTATAKIKRMDFGLKFNALAEGVAVVSNEVTILLDGEVFRKL